MASIYSRFKEMVQRQPQATALRTATQTVGYSRLDALAAAIQARFPDERPRIVGIVMDHGVELVATILAVLRAGAAYVAAEPGLPPERIRYMMNEAGVDFVATSDAYRHRFAGFRTITVQAALKPLAPERMAETEAGRTPAPVAVHADAPAYVIFTTGRSGRSNGVVVSQDNVMHFADAFEREFRIGRADVVMQLSVATFDLFEEELFGTLLNGAILLIPPAGILNDTARLLEFADEHGATIITGFPQLLSDINRCVAAGKRLPRSLRLLKSRGDVLFSGFVDHLVDKVEVYNSYAPAEAAAGATLYRCNGSQVLADGAYPMGRAVDGTEVEVLDDRLRSVVPGLEGEICVMGDGVARGYIGDNPENVNFVNMPDGRRCFCTGDIGYTLADGTVVFLRRKERNVVIEGTRVECDAVADALRRLPEVESGVVCPATDSQGLAFLTAYIVPRHGLKISLARLRKKLGRYLSAVSMPKFFVRLKKLPLNPNGDLDEGALPFASKRPSGGWAGVNTI